MHLRRAANWTVPVFFLFWLALSPPAHADIHVHEVLGASAFTSLVPDETGVIPNLIIYGGVAGDGSAAECAPSERDNLSTCNNCSFSGSDWGVVCNQRRIYPTLELRITFTNLGSAGYVRLFGPNDTEVSELRPASYYLDSGATGTVNVAWSALCALTETGQVGDPDCTTRRDINLRLGIDRNGNNTLDAGEYKSFQVRVVSVSADAQNQSFAEDCSDGNASSPTGGLCYFETFPGDRKAYLINPVAPPNMANNYQSVVVFCYGTGDVTFNPSYFDEISPADVCATIEVEAATTEQPDVEMVDGVIKGLENNLGYYFRVASVDFAGNISQFTHPSSDTECMDPSEDACRFAVPATVEGILSEDLNCFIATAAFGSPLHPKVSDFRAFRDQVLLGSAWGAGLVELYYELSPPLAQKISKSFVLRQMAQAFLWPVWVAAKIYLVSPLLFLLLALAVPAGAWGAGRGRRAALPILILTVALPGWAQNHPNEPPYTDAPEPGFSSPAGGSSNLPEQKAAPKPRPETRRGFALKGGAFRPVEITNEKTGVSFSEIYGTRKGPILFLDFDFLLMKPLGQVHFKLGTGAYVSKPGSGRFVSDAPTNVGRESMEKFTYIIFPNTATLQYKFQFSPTQWIVPYAEGGGGYFAFMENRDDTFKPKLGGAPVGVGGGGVQILLDHLDHFSMTQLRGDYGIQHVWLVLDFKHIQGLHDTYDFTSSIINGGFYLEF